MTTPEVDLPSADDDLVFPEVLQSHAAKRPDHVAFHELLDGENVSASVTYGALSRNVEMISSLLTQRTRRADRVIVLVRRPSLFVPAFLACLRAGRIAVPVASPTSANVAPAALRAIIATSGASAVLTDIVDEVASLTADREDCTVLDVTQRIADANLDLPIPRSEDVAFLQFTSGSTGAPRGVVVRHGSLMANQAQIHSRFEQDEDAVVVSWLPTYHDMGLIGAILHPLYLGATAVLMPPEAFLERPVRWLRAISRFGGTVSPAPNFAFDLCVARVRDEDLLNVDLSTWTVACNGAEPVRESTLLAFAARFESSGFDPSAHSPAYGLAEATLMVSAVGRGSAAATSGGRVSCGRPVCDLRIVTSEGEPVRTGMVGEIQVRGPNVTDGYWDSATATSVPDESWHGGGWMSTGDVGFLEQGELYVSGRVKDVLVVRGRNLHPHDIEDTAQIASPLARRGDGAVVQDDDAIVLVQGLFDRTRANEAAQQIRAAVVRGHGVALDDILFVSPGDVPRTTSGKVRRQETLNRLRQGTLSVIAVSHAAGGRDRERKRAGAVEVDAVRLADAVRNFLQLPGDMDVNDTPLVALGLDSLRAVQLREQLRDELKIEVALADLFAVNGIAELAKVVRRADGQPASSVGDAEHNLDHNATEASSWERVIWGVQQRNPADTAYVISRLFLLDNKVAVTDLSAAFQAVVEQQPLLSTVYRLRGAALLRESGPRPVAQHHRVPDAAAAAGRRAKTAMDLSVGPLISLDVFEDNAVRLLLLRLHHVVADMTSAALLMEDLLAAAYGATATVRKASAAGYTQRRSALTKEAADWRSALSDAEPLWLPSSSSAASEVGEGRVRWIEVTAESLANVDEVAVYNQATRAAVLLALQVLWLSRICDQNAVSLAIPLSLRSSVADLSTPGYAVSTVPLTVTVDENGTFHDLVRQCSVAQMRVLALRGLPLPELAADPVTAARAQDAMRCLFGYLEGTRSRVDGLVGVALQAPGSELIAFGARLPLMPLPIPALAALDLAYGVTGDGLTGRLVLDAAMFDDGQSDLLVDYLSQVQHGAIRQPDTILRDLMIQRIGFNEPQPPVGESRGTLGDRWREQAEAHPERNALVTPCDEFTYGQVDRAVHRVLRGLGTIRPTSVVALLFTDREAMVPAMLAVHLAGAAVLPLGPASPDADLRFMIEDCRADLLLVESSLEDRARALAAVCQNPPRVVLVPDLHTLVAGDDATPELRAAVPVSRNSTAYVIYTSGSTGSPKGVPITHANVLPLLDWQVTGLGIDSGFRLVQTLAPTFDYGLQEIWTPLLYGGTLLIPSDRIRANPGEYVRFANDQNVNALFITPSFARELVAWNRPFHSVRLLVLGGEMLTYELVERITALLPPHATVINGYGPTETSINCTMHVVSRSGQRGVVPVGVPTGASEVRLRDRQGRRVPPGVIGEVTIGGPGVAAGYLSRPEETGDRFVSDLEPTGKTWYRSGDRGMWNANGELVILGRDDRQAKISGFRVEVMEVEARLRALDGVHEVAVVVDRRRDIARLVAFVVAPNIDEATLHRTALASMPPHLCPDRVCIVTKIARTVHGKLDTDVLLAVADSQQRARSHDPLDVVLDAWRAVLGVDVDPDDQFFARGGHSLGATHVMSRVRADLDLPDLPLHLFFEHVTPRRFADYITSLVGVSATPIEGLASPRKVRGRQRRLGMS